MIKSSLAFIASTMVQDIRPPAPATPKMGGPAPPVGDVPLDSGIVVLLVIAVIIGVIAIYNNRNRATA